MKIGIVGTIWIQIPPMKYGGTEQVISDLANGLVEKEHDVTLFAPNTTKTKARLIPTVDFPLREKHIPWTDISYHVFHLTQAFDRQSEFDILHLHLNKNQDYIALPLATQCKTPVITTIHFALPTASWRKERDQVLQKYSALPYTSISYAQRTHSHLNFIETVYNSINISSYPYINRPKDYFLWLGKIKQYKGTKEAILAAKKAGVPLIIAGIVDSGVPEDVTYFEKKVKPYIDNKQIRYIGEVGLPQKAKLLGEAIALLNPVQWEEPFGLTMIEAQATGTPVIATKKGATNEVIQDGETGFLVESVSEMAKKIHEISTIKREACRKFIEQKFTTKQMIAGYEKAFTTTIANWPTYQMQQQELIEEYKGKVAKT